MDKSLLESLEARAKHRRYEPGEIIIRQGGRDDAFYVLASGTVAICQQTDSGAAELISSISTPAFFGETGLMEEGRRTATVRVPDESPAEVLVISRQLFCDFFEVSEMMADEIAMLMRQHRIKDSVEVL